MSSTARFHSLFLGPLLVFAGAISAKPYEAIKGESTLNYLMVHPMHKIRAASRDFVCTVDLSPDTVSSKIRVSAEVKTFDSGNSSRDSHALEVIDGIKYPRVEFVSDGVKPEGDGYAVTGKLTFHGRTKPVNFHVTPHFQPGKVEITGGFEVKLTDFDVERPSLMLIPVEDNLRISFDVFSKLD